MARPARVRLLDRIPELMEGLSVDSARHATRECTAALHVCGQAQREWRELAGLDGPYLILLEGFALIRTSLDESRRSIEVVGPGDLISLAPTRGDEDGIKVEIRIVDEASVAVLDRAFEVSAAKWPKVGRNVAALAIRRAMEMSRTLAVMHVPRLRQRLHQLLWRLAERWGHVTPDGVGCRSS